MARELPVSTSEYTPYRQPTVNNVDFGENDHDKLVSDEGNRIVFEKALKCPCRTTYKNKAHSDCVNCKGMGFVYINPLKTKALVTSQSKKLKFTLSGESMGDGDIDVTPMSGVVMSEMDRITLYQSLGVVIEDPVTYFDFSKNCMVAKFVYPIVEIDQIFEFISYDTKLNQVKEEDYEIEDNFIYFKNKVTEEDLSITTRYYYRPIYVISKVLRHCRDIQLVDTSGEMQTKVYPQQLQARILHSVSNYGNNINTNED